jgi:hypothetical protein
VLIVEYFDPTTGQGGRHCKYATMSRDEFAWAQANVVQPLNRAVAEAAREHNWRLVEGVDEAFAEHGICQSRARRWVRTPVESFFRQDADDEYQSIAGTLHPNARGHFATARLIRAELAKALGETLPGDRPEEADDDGPFGPATIVLIVGILAVIAAVAAFFASRRRQRRRHEPATEA